MDKYETFLYSLVILMVGLIVVSFVFAGASCSAKSSQAEYRLKQDAAARGCSVVGTNQDIICPPQPKNRDIGVAY